MTIIAPKIAHFSVEEYHHMIESGILVIPVSDIFVI